MFKVVWIRYRKEYKDKNFSHPSDTINYIANKYGVDITDLRITYINIPSFPSEMIFDYYGQIVAYIIKTKEQD